MDSPSACSTACAANGVLLRVLIEQINGSLACNLEVLPNLEVGVAPALLAVHPKCSMLIISCGLINFTCFCLFSTDDRSAACASRKTAIERHEPCLRDVNVLIERKPSGVNRLNFVINAMLQGAALAEPVNFNAVLQRCGEQVKGVKLAIGTAIATFDEKGRHINDSTGKSHAAIYLGQAAASIQMLD